MKLSRLLLTLALKLLHMLHLVRNRSDQSDTSGQVLNFGLSLYSVESVLNHSFDKQKREEI